MRKLVSISGLVFMVACLLLLPLGCGSGSGSDEPIKIGVIQPLTGPIARDGLATAKGAELAAKDLNDNGGVLGREVELIIEDGKNDPAESVSAAQKLIVEDKVSAILGAWGSSPTLAVMPIVDKNGVPLVVECATNPAITGESGNTWTFRFSSTEEINASHIAGPLVNEHGFSNIAFLAQNTDWGRSQVEVYSKYFEAAGQPIGYVAYYDPGESDFMPYLTKVKSEGAGALIISADINTTVLINKQIHELGLDIKRLASGIPTESVLELAGPEVAEGLYIWEPYAPGHWEDTDVNEAFVGLYQEKNPGKTPGKFVAAGFDGINVIAAAIEKAGSDDRAAIRDSLEETDYPGLTCDVQFDESHQAIPNMFIKEITGGEIVAHQY